MNTTLFENLLDPIEECLTQEAARKIFSVRADAATQARADELADRANFGILTNEERAEYDNLLSVFHFVTIMQARARRVLNAS